MTTPADALRAAMPLLARHEGRWTGTYRYVTPDGTLIDRHASELVCSFRDDPDFPYFQTNASIWPDRPRLDMEYPARFDGQGIAFDTPIIRGRFWETGGDPTASTILGHWVWTDPSFIPFPADAIEMFEMIQLSRCGRYRSRVWQWLDSGRLVLRTLIEEERA
ncbi:MAG: hypothetical protein ACK4MT_00400 [Thermaurantiacus tibetensis]|uniref:DUF3598 domain-containing protein n=1 Tax=Thermaurantiacus tibetensis TaxID=2759035 RepID=UPI001890B0E4|nr:DUF3598 domain-containing protein [Thermaurantiacus tibetensis]